MITGEQEREAIIAYILRRLSGDAALDKRPASNVLYEIVDAIEAGDHLVPEAEAIQRWHRRLDHAEAREREAIVAWLRRTDVDDERSSRSHLAHLIERGEHHQLLTEPKCTCMVGPQRHNPDAYHAPTCPLHRPEPSR